MALKNVNTNVALSSKVISAADKAALSELATRGGQVRVHQLGGTSLIAVGKFSSKIGPLGDNHGLSEELVSILSQAADIGAMYVEFSKDGPSVPTERAHADLSTGHLRNADYEVLQSISDGERAAPIHVADHAYGFVVDVSTAGSADALQNAGLSKEFTALVDAAREAGANFIDFDSDADLDPGFPEFDPVFDEEIEHEEALRF